MKNTKYDKTLFIVRTASIYIKFYSTSILKYRVISKELKSKESIARYQVFGMQTAVVYAFMV